MGAQSQRRRGGRAGGHRRAGEPLAERREHVPGRRHRRLPIPAPSPSALVGIAVLVLIGGGVIHLSSTGSAVPLDDAPGTAVEVAPPAEQETGPGQQPQGQQQEPSTQEPGGPDDTDPARSGATTAPAAEDVVVHISGAVEQPGLVELPAGARVDDAVQAAGGATGEADLTAVNLARGLVDGEQIHVPRPGEPLPASAGAADGDEPSEHGSEGPAGGDGPIDLNTAGPGTLEELPGVGPAIAGRIIDHREKNGPFASVEDLIEVSGIGPATLDKIRDRATV